MNSSQAFVDGEVFSLKTLIDANIGKRPVFFDGTIGGYTKTDDAHELAYDFRQAGLTKQVGWRTDRHVRRRRPLTTQRGC